MVDRYLFRGVSRHQYFEQDSGLRPKQIGEFKHVFRMGEIVNKRTGRSLRMGEGAVMGENESNPVLRHQIDPEGSPTSGISTTPHYHRAEHYATHGYSQDGCILKINRDLFEQYGIREFVVKDFVPRPSIPEDDEIILVAKNGGVLPVGILVEVVEV